MHTQAEIDALIERAGLKDVVSVFSSAIEIDIHQLDWHDYARDGYAVLARLLAECERAATERAAQACDERRARCQEWQDVALLEDAARDIRALLSD